MDIYYPTLTHYLNSLLPERPPELQVMEEFARKSGFPILNPASAYFCYQITRLTGARSVFELGSGYGYSTAWFALAVRENGGGKVFHTVWDVELTNRARQHLTALGLNDLIEYHTGEAVQALRDSQGPFDLIFNDIEKTSYPASLPVIAEKLRPGGVLLADNLLWGGRVFNGNDHSPATQSIRKFTLDVIGDPAWIASIIPTGDGLLLAYKK